MEKKSLPQRLAGLSLLLVALIWGSGFIATELALRANMDTALITAARFFIAALIMLPSQLKKLRALTRHQWFIGLTAGTILSLAFLAQTYGQAHSSVSTSAFLTATNVVMVPFIVWVMTRKRPSAKVYLLAFFTFIGIAVLTFKPASGGLSFSAGDIFVLLGAFLFALHIAYLGTTAQRIDPKVLTFLQMLFAALVALLFLPFTYQSARALSLEGLLPIVYLACFSTCLCFYIQTTAQQKTTAAKAAIFLSTEGLFGSLFSVALGLEAFTWQMGMGGVIIIACVILTELDLTKLSRPQKN